jgi:hypothetical protein
MNSRISACISSLSLLLCLALPTFGQVDRANVKGVVTDVSDAIVPHAHVEVLFPQTGFTRSVDASDGGEYVLPGLPLGGCVLSVSAPGFATSRIQDITLTVGDFRTIDVKLAVNGIEQSVSVSASTATLDQDSAATGGVVAQQQVENLPINGRNWANLMILIPGAINTGNGNQLSVRFAGRGIDDNKITFDGVDATGILRQAQKLDLRIQLSTESIAEFRVNSAVYSAEFGGTSGGQGDVVSKAGTNQLHGSLYEFLRNDVLNARALFSTSQLPLRLNQFGASVGGPLYKNRTFFFANYEALRQSLSQPIVGFVPSPAYLSATLAKQPALAPVLAGYPAGQTATSNPNINQFNGTAKQTQNEDFGLIRIDQVFSPRTSAFFRLNLDQGRLVTPVGDTTGFIGDALGTQDDPKNAVLSVQHIFLPTLLNDLKVSVNRTPYYAQNLSVAPFQLVVAGLSTLHDTLQQTQGSTAYSLVDSVNFSFGRHSIVTGGGLRHVALNLSSTQETQYSFTSLTTLQNNTLNGATLIAPVPNEDAKKLEFDLFFQDQFKFKRTLMFSLGMRYDNFGVFSPLNGRDLPFDPLTCPTGYCQAGIPFYNSDPKDFEPRVAVTWSPSFLHDQTVLRAGYGIFSGEAQLGDLVAPLSNLGQRLSLTAAQLGTPSFPIPPSLTSATLTSNAPKGLARNRVNEQIEQWGVSIEQRFPFQILTNIGYMGNHGAHLPLHTVLNVLDPVTRVAPLPAYGLIDYKEMGANSNFSGLVASLNRQFSSGLLFGANYIWSHSTDDNANVGNNTGAEGDLLQNVNCRVCDRATSDQDIRHSFTANVVYELPFHKGQSDRNFTNALAQGWKVSGIGVARTGLPVNTTISRTAASLPDGNTMSPQRPNRVPGVSLIPTQGRTPQLWINPAAFSIPAAGTFGNASRNLAHAPGTWQIDMSLEKQLLTADRFALKFRAEGFNMLNRAQYGVPASVFNTASYGQITSQINAGPTGTATQRVFEFSLRLAY